MPSLRQLTSGESRTVQVIRKYGKAVFRETIRDLLDYSERRMRAELEAIPDGIYGFKDYIESDGVDADRTYTIEAEVHKFGDGIVIDYAGSSSQAKGPINATLGVATSAAWKIAREKRRRDALLRAAISLNAKLDKTSY